jgi:chaperonin cofactor prefoldin
MNDPKAPVIIESVGTSNPPRPKKTLEQKLQEKQEVIAARLATIAARRKADTRERMARLDRIIGAACRADESMRAAVIASLHRTVKVPADREFLKIEGWL